MYRNDVQDRIDLTDIHYPDESTDIFICSHMFEHIPDDRKAMRELYRILKPSGFGLVLVPLAVGVDDTHEDPTIVSDELRWKYFGMGDHVRHYGKRDFVERLTAAGFIVDQLGVEYFGRETFRRAGIAGNSVLYVVRKEESAGGAATGRAARRRAAGPDRSGGGAGPDRSVATIGSDITAAVTEQRDEDDHQRKQQDWQGLKRSWPSSHLHLAADVRRSPRRRNVPVAPPLDANQPFDISQQLLAGVPGRS